MVKDAPKFIGYGGSAVEYETKVYTYRGMEIRIPQRPDVFHPDDVSAEYACFSAHTLEEATEEVDELLDE